MFVSVEGIDGAGKDTVIEGLQESDEFGDALFTREPNDDTYYGEFVRKVMGDEDAPPMTVFFAFMADHAAHIEHVVRPALDAGETVICGRGIDSRYAYQTDQLGDVIDEPLEYIRMIQETDDWTVFPDVTLYLDISVETAMDRIDARGEETERFEKRDSLAEKRDIFLELAAEFDDRYVIIDGEQPPEQVLADCLDAIGKRMADSK